jgi:hypothetical protein
VQEESGIIMTRRVRIVSLSFWPGLAQIWSGQEILGILLGILFAANLNLTVVGHWIWRDALPAGWVDFFAAMAGITWLASLGYTLWWVRFCHPERHRTEIDRLFREAHEAYLQGHWGESRVRIEHILAMDESDGDALMQLGALYVRTNQPTLARRTFRQCLDSKQGAKWRWEIHRELVRLADES